MADVKFTGLPAASGVPDNGSLVAISTFDGVSTYTSEKYTMSQLKDIVYVLETGDSITGDNIPLHGTTSVEMQGGGVTDYSNGWVYVDGSELSAGYGLGAGSTSGYFFNSGGFGLQYNSSNLIEGNSTGIGFFGSTPVAKPSITGSRGGNAALADLLTDLASLGLITDSTTA